MTRKKDMKKAKKDFVEKNKIFTKSRLNLKQQEIKKENQLLKKVQNLPDEIITIIYNYLSENAKLICNFKFEYLIKKFDTFDFYNTFRLLEYLSKKELLDLVHKGFLQKYPEIINSVNGLFFCLDVNEYSDVFGYRLFDLWENNDLVTSVSNREEFIDELIKFEIKISIRIYIKDIIQLFVKNKSRISSQKNWIIKGNTLFKNLDKVFYIYKCLEDLVYRKYI